MSRPGAVSQQENQMALRYYGVGKYETEATVSTSTTSKSVELVVDNAAGLQKKDIILALDEIKDAVLQDTGWNDI